MKAAVYTQYGPPEVVKILEVDKPVPKQSEVLIKAHASTVNRTDCGFRSANHFIVRFWSGMLRPRVPILGCEFAGEIYAVGNQVKNLRPGERVFGYNDVTFGGHGEYMIMDEKGPMALIPEGLTYEDAAPITEGSHYALCDLRAAKLKAGDKILINGATGAIGSAAVQLAKYFGAEVTAVCATQHLNLVKALGADTVIDYTKEDFTKLNEKFDIIFDAVGKSSFAKCLPLLHKKGIYMSTELGYMAQNPFLALITPLLGGKKLLFPIPSINREDVQFLKMLVETKKFKPLIDRSFPLEQIVEAYHYVEKGFKTGNVLITHTG